MGRPILAETVATYRGTWPTTEHFGFGPPSELIGDVGQELLSDGLTISSSQILGGSFAALTGGPVTVALQIVNHSGVELDDTDLVQQIDDALFSVIGQHQTSGAITQIGNALTPAGQATPVQSKSFACGDPSWGFIDDPGQWFQCLTTKGLSTLGLVFIGLALGLVLLFTARRANPL